MPDYKLTEAAKKDLREISAYTKKKEGRPLYIYI
jgi:plasmid stabilization system protein ParE